MLSKGWICKNKVIVHFMFLSSIYRRIQLTSSFIHPITQKLSRPIYSCGYFNNVPKTSAVYNQKQHLCLKSNNDNEFKNSNNPSWPYIKSKKNPTVKLFQSLLSKKKARDEHNLTVIEGFRLVVDLLQSIKHKHVLPNILVTEDALTHDEYGIILQNLLKEKENDSKICIVSNDVLQVCTDTVSPQGIVATIQTPSLDSSNFNKDKLLEKPNNSLVLILDGLSDPGNVGTLLRTCSALGSTISGIIMLHDTVDVYMPKVIRSSMGAIFSASNIIQLSSFDNVQELLKECNVNTIYAATMMSTSTQLSKPYWEMNCNENIALCLGSEASGLSSDLREKIEEGVIRAIHIPMSPDSIESLNAAVSGSIIMYEYYRQTLI